MTKKDEGKTVERSRLTLLGGLAAAAAGGGCNGDNKPGTRTSTFDRRQKNPFEEDERGGDGGDGGGGGSH